MRYFVKLLFIILLGLTITACDGDDNDSEDTNSPPTETSDTTPPVIALQGDNPMTMLQGHSYTEPGATARDDVDGSVDVVYEGSVDSSQIGQYTLTYKATDSAGNTGTATRIVNVVEDTTNNVNPPEPTEDNTPPVITINGDNPVTIVQGGNYSDAGATANDDVDGAVAVSTSGSVDTSQIGSYTITYKAEDSSGNEATATRTVNVIVDVNAIEPIEDVEFTLSASNIIVSWKSAENVTYDICYARQLIEEFADCEDYVSGVLNTEQTSPVTISGLTEGLEYYVSLLARNDAGRSVVSNSESITVPENNNGGNNGGNTGGGTNPPEPTDTTAPTITINGDNPTNIVQGNNYIDAGATAIDDIDGNIAVTSRSTVDINNIGRYTVTYTATDSSSNRNTATRVVNVAEDTSNTDNTPPVITINGNNPVTITQGEAYNDAGATANDAVDGAVAVSTSGSVDTSQIGSYTITYRAEDSSGNEATATRIVNVLENTSNNDTDPPLITITGDNPANVSKDIEYIDAKAIAIDDIDGEVNVFTTHDVNINTIGTYTVNYTATDRVGNTSTATRIVNVVEETTLPPHPGKVGTETLLGIDSDNDGLRDDIQIFIAKTYEGDNEKIRTLSKSPRALQDIFKALLDDDEEKIRLGIDERNDAIACNHGLRQMDEEDEIHILMLDTEERFIMYRKVTRFMATTYNGKAHSSDTTLEEFCSD